ncbi:filamentous hemagglutinin family domain-containing protein [Candidatus Magnetomorum sp. HK-1]|nr:filamentous hemagglutinin family domain-containing protein [Candidatus Magnetomorum sp. HK-1]
MKRNNFIKFIIIVLIWTTPARSENNQPNGIIIDDTIGTSGSKILEGPDYHIFAELGQIKGNNLFHSFQTFNVHKNERAIFYAPETINNIISRVTGNEMSWIDGGIQSIAPNADIYLFNPNGIFWGPNARLDVQRSFHISTCDNIGFSDQTKFKANSDSIILTSASPISFGFIDSDVAQLHIQGKGNVFPTSENELIPSILVKDTNNISLIAGNISIDNGTVNSESDFPGGTIITNKGRINIVSVASAGDVIIQNGNLDISSFEQMGKIQISDQSVISSSSGEIYIYADHLNMNSSYINAGQFSPDGSTVLGFAGGSIDINVNKLSVLNGSQIIIETLGSESSGDIYIHAGDIFIEGFDENHSSSISTSSISLDNIDLLEKKNISNSIKINEKNTGNAGNINIITDNLFLSNSGRIEANAFSQGNGGKILITASDTIDISSDLSKFCGIMAISLSDHENGGNAGDISIQSKRLFIKNGGKIINSTGGTANGGWIDIHVDENLFIQSVDQDIDIEDPPYEKISGIFSNTVSELENAGNAGSIRISGSSFYMNQLSSINVSSHSEGDAGRIFLDFETIQMENYAGIQSVSHGDGDSGLLFIHAEKFVSLENYAMIGAQSLKKGKPGGIIIDTPLVNMDNYATISTTSLSQDNTTDGLGVLIGQEVEVNDPEYTINKACEEININKHSEISTESHGNGSAGLVHIFSQNIYMDEHAVISSSSMLNGDSGDSGEIILQSKKISLNNDSFITTENAGKGDAGIIQISTQHLDMNHGARIYSTNTHGKDGGSSGIIFINKKIEAILPDDQSIILPSDQISIKNNSGLSTSSLSEGGAGAIILRVINLEMSNSGFISAENKYPGLSKEFGIISVRAEKISLNSKSKISTQSESEGDAGGIALEAGSILLSGESFISSAGVDPDRNGSGGHIFIAKSFSHIDDVIFGFVEIEDEISAQNIFQLKETVDTISLNDSAYISTSTEGSGNAGGILIGSKNLILSGGARISSESTSSTGGGAAGLIKIDNADHLSLIQGSTISTQAVNTSVPDVIQPGIIDQDRLNGMISITVSGNIHLFDAGISSSVLGGLGNGGNLSILSKDLLMNRSQVIANAYEGNGGNIYISSDYLIQSTDSIISASSQLGIDGNIEIEALNENFDKQLIFLPENFLDASKWIKTPCESRKKEDYSHFIVKHKDAQPTPFEDWQPTR